MGHYEDIFYQITESINNLGLKKQFDDQLEKMRHQDKHRYKEMCCRDEGRHKGCYTIRYSIS